MKYQKMEAGSVAVMRELTVAEIEAVMGGEANVACPPGTTMTGATVTGPTSTVSITMGVATNGTGVTTVTTNNSGSTTLTCAANSSSGGGSGSSSSSSSVGSSSSSSAGA